MIFLLVTSERTKQTAIPESKAPSILVSILSPIIKQFAACAPGFFTHNGHP